MDDLTHMLLLAKERVRWGSTVYVYGLLVKSAEADKPDTFPQSGTIQFCFQTEKKCDEYLGLRKEDEE